METILIKGIEKKPTKKGGEFWVIKFNDGRQATIGQWDAPLAHFIETSVCVGGQVEVELQQKGEYLNITGVNQNDGWTRGIENPAQPQPLTTSSKALPAVPVVPVVPSDNPMDLLSIKDKIIVSQVMVKEANNKICAFLKSGGEIQEGLYGEWLCDSVRELVGAYKVALKALE